MENKNFNESLGIDEKNANQQSKIQPQAPSGVYDYFAFRKLISLTFIQIIYFLGLVGITIFGFILIVDGNSFEFTIGIGILTLGNVIWRVMCEGLIIIFRLASSVSKIETNCQK